MSTCATKHPEYPHLSCVLQRSDRGHREHLAMRYLPDKSQPEQLVWPDPDYRSPDQIREQAHQASVTIEKHADAVRTEIRRNTPQVPLGARAGQRKKTRLGLVANMLVNNVGVWIDGHRFVDQQTGGTAGLRRILELRNEYGWAIENRPVPGTTDQYRLTELPDEFKDA